MEEQNKDLLFEIKQLKQSMTIMRDIIDKQQQKIMFFDRLLYDGIQIEKQRINECREHE